MGLAHRMNRESDEIKRKEKRKRREIWSSRTASNGGRRKDRVIEQRKTKALRQRVDGIIEEKLARYKSS